MTPYTLVLGQHDLEKVLRAYGRHEIMDLVIARLTDELAAAAGTGGLTPAREGFERESSHGVLEWMPHHDPGRSVTIKTVSYTPDNPKLRSLPTIMGTLSRFDDASGHLMAIADGNLLTAIRTGAATAIASRLLAEPHSSVIGMIGAGAQSVTQLHALSRTFPVRHVLVYDVEPAHVQSYGSRVAFLGLDVQPASLPELQQQADIICTATSVAAGAGPVFADERLKPHVHVNAIGADLPGKIELPISLLRRAFICPDHHEQAQREGECQQLQASDIGPTLPALCADPQLALPYQGQVTVFDSTGFALEDHVAFDVLLDLAAPLGLGTYMYVEYLPQDALNPYSPAISLPVGQTSVDQFRSIGRPQLLTR